MSASSQRRRATRRIPGGMAVREAIARTEPTTRDIIREYAEKALSEEVAEQINTVRREAFEAGYLAHERAMALHDLGMGASDQAERDQAYARWQQARSNR
jgi:hypothetical protein